MERLYQHKLVSEVLAYVVNPNPRKQAPSFSPKINLGAVDKQMCVLNIEDNQIHLDFKVWDEHYLLTFNIPHYLNSRDVKKWFLPRLNSVRVNLITYSVLRRTSLLGNLLITKRV